MTETRTMTDPDAYVVAAEPRDGRTVFVEFDDGTSKVVDLAPYLTRGVLAKLGVDDGAFRELYVDFGTVCWPGRRDLAPELLASLPDVVSTGSTTSS